MSEVNSARYDRCRCWRAERGEEVRRRAAVSGLWSVSKENSLPSKKKWKWRTAA